MNDTSRSPLQIEEDKRIQIIESLLYRWSIGELSKEEMMHQLGTLEQNHKHIWKYTGMVYYSDPLKYGYKCEECGETKITREIPK